MFSLRTLVPLLAIAILLVAPAEATTSYYTGSSGESSFTTAIAGLTLMDPALTFSGTPGSTGLLDASGTGIDFLGFDDFGALNPKTFTVSSGNLTAAFANDVTEITFPAAGVYAFGIHLTTTIGNGNWCVDLTTGGCNYNPTENNTTTVFFGFVSTTPVTAPLYIRPLGSGNTTVFTNFEAYGAASDPPVPESRTMLLVGLGLVIFPLVRRKIRQPI
jgi:hypothetical protein